VVGFRQAKKKRALRIYFVSDLHGSEVCFRKFLAAAKVYEPDVLILGGDFAGKGLVPVLRQGDSWSATVDGQQIREQARRWCDLVSERLDPSIRCIITPGNDDPVEADEIYEASDRVEFPSFQVCSLGPFSMASLGMVPITPWNTERECSEEELAKRIDDMLEPLPAGTTCILNFHSPPYASTLDDAPELDASLKPVIRGGRPSIVPVGSHAVRAAIKKYQPPVALHGHIHESRGVQKIGRTLCINPGSDYSSGVLRGAVIDLAEDGTCLDFLLTTG
jgi:Icc-related predicted phosphoesterase